MALNKQYLFYYLTNMPFISCRSRLQHLLFPVGCSNSLQWTHWPTKSYQCLLCQVPLPFPRLMTSISTTAYQLSAARRRRAVDYVPNGIAKPTFFFCKRNAPAILCEERTAHCLRQCTLDVNGPLRRWYFQLFIQGYLLLITRLI